ncbi:MAG: TetR/AcrR family transcriptional regulator [Verrucomicrobiota bacterium]
MKQRKKQPVQTRQAILDAAGTEFSTHGYAGTGLGAIVTRAALTKGALFHHFPDKQALAATWIETSLATAIEALWITPVAEIGSLDALRSLCRARCLELEPGDATSALVALTAESAATDPLLGAALERIFGAWRAAIAGLLERGQAAGWVHRSIQPAGEAVFLVASIAGFSVTTRCHPDESIRRTCATAVESYLETLRAQ